MRSVVTSVVFLSMAVVLFCLSGCATHNLRIADETIVRQIKPDVTTIQDVQILLGDPDPVGHLLSGDVNWGYHVTVNNVFWTVGIIFRDNIVRFVGYTKVDYGSRPPVVTHIYEAQGVQKVSSPKY